eukprot:6183726-Pleurochrysis_carterae.AAC.3
MHAWASGRVRNLEQPILTPVIMPLRFQLQICEFTVLGSRIVHDPAVPTAAMLARRRTRRLK